MNPENGIHIEGGFLVDKEAFAKMRDETEEVHSGLSGVYDQAAQALLAAAATGQGDDSLLGHSERVCLYCMSLAKNIEMPAHEIAELRHAANLHDIGKIGVSKRIVNKLGKLTNDELAAMRMHSLIGVRILEKIEGLRGALPMIKHHHERWDGAGYPDGLSGENIPIGARIIAIAEAFDILTSDVPWRNGLSEREAVREILRCSGTQFDPHLVEVFVKKVLGYDVGDFDKLCA